MGVELVACIEIYGHMEQYLRWGTDPDIMDSSCTLLADREATYKLLDEMIRTGIGNECAPYNLVAEISPCLLKAIPQMGRI